MEALTTREWRREPAGRGAMGSAKELEREMTRGRSDIIRQHGSTYNQGRDNCGHITLENGDVVLLVTETGHEYNNGGLQADGTTYTWLSQNGTKAESKKGQQIQTAGTDTTVHLWTRPKKAAVKFSYRGTVTYIAHTGEQPMTVTFRLNQ